MPGSPAPPTAADRARAYVANAVSISGTMARYALARQGRGIENGLRALGTLAREVTAAARPGARAEGASGADKGCPICGWQGPRFGPAYYYDSYREDARCYVCGSTERCRLLKLYIARHLGGFFAERRRVLDIGPVRYSRGFFPDGIDYVSFDLASEVAMVRGDLCHAPFPDASFDTWLCSHVLDLIPDDTQAMRELLRLLRPGGFGILDNAMSWERKTEDYGGPRASECGHRRRYGFDLVDRLSAVGFDVERVDSTALFDEAERRHYGMTPRVLLIAARAPDGAEGPAGSGVCFTARALPAAQPPTRCVIRSHALVALIVHRLVRPASQQENNTWGSTRSSSAEFLSTASSVTGRS